MAHAQTRRASRSSTRGEAAPLCFNVKLASGAVPPHPLVDTGGVVRVERLFPDEDDDELARLYFIEVRSSSVDTVLEQLRQDPLVEFVEKAPKRKLIK